MNATIIPTGAPQTAGATETLNVTGLAPDTDYWFALRTSDNKSNWSPLSDIAQVRTLTTSTGLPTVDSVSFNPTNATLEVVFSEPMNRTSVEQSLSINPGMSLSVTWVSDQHLQIHFSKTLASNMTYLLAIAPLAADQTGTPMAKTFTFRFAGIGGPQGSLPAPVDLAIPFLLGIAALGGISLAVFVRSVRSQKKVVRMQRAMAFLARRLTVLNMTDRARDLRAWILSSRSGRAPVIPPRERRK
jgi:chitodextrinase